MRKILQKLGTMLILSTLVLSLAACSLKPHHDIYYTAENYATALINRDYDELNRLSSSISAKSLELINYELDSDDQNYIQYAMEIKVDAGSIDNHPWYEKGSIDIIVSLSDYKKLPDIDAHSFVVTLNIKKVDGEWKVTNSNDAIFATYSWLLESQE